MERITPVYPQTAQGRAKDLLDAVKGKLGIVPKRTSKSSRFPKTQGERSATRSRPATHSIRSRRRELRDSSREGDEANPFGNHPFSPAGD
jgi:hypothetical protein